MLEPYERELRVLVLPTPDMTRAELQGEVARLAGIRAGLSTLHDALHRLGLRRKKSL